MGKWRSRPMVQSFLVVLSLLLIMIAAFMAVRSASDILPYFLFVVPFIAVSTAFVYGAYPHGTQKQHVDAATALVVYVGVVLVWLLARQNVRDEELRLAIDAFAIFGQLASFLTSMKESVLAWIAPAQFQVLTPAGRQARKAQRQVNHHLYVPKAPEDTPILTLDAQEEAHTNRS